MNKLTSVSVLISVLCSEKHTIYILLVKCIPGHVLCMFKIKVILEIWLHI